MGSYGVSFYMYRGIQLLTGCVLIVGILFLYECKSKTPDIKEKTDSLGPRSKESGSSHLQMVIVHPQVIDITDDAEKPARLESRFPELLKDAFRASAFFVLKEKETPDQEDFTGTISILYLLIGNGRIDPKLDQGAIHVGIDMTFSREIPGYMREVYADIYKYSATFVPEDVKDREAFVYQKVLYAIKQVIERMDIQVRMHYADDAELIRSLESDDSYVLDFAIQNIGFKKVSVAAPSLIRLLKHPEKNAVLRTIGTLAVLKTPDAVKPMVELTKGDDDEITSAVIFALGDIGTDQAKAYLESIEASHPSPFIQENARNALKQMKKK